MILVDEPIWPAHGRRYAHLASDASLGELHAFAAALGLHPGAYDGDHYDLPEDRVPDAVSAGAHPVPARELLTRVQAAGLRFRKRRGERPVARLADVMLAAGGVPHVVDLATSSRQLPDAEVIAAVVLVEDDAGRIVCVHNPHRDTWELPGGRREPGESVVQCAERELWEEAGVRATGLHQVGWERVTIERPHAWLRHPFGYIAFFRGAGTGALQPRLDDTDAAVWLSRSELEDRCGTAFWWPLVARVLEDG